MDADEFNGTIGRYHWDSTPAWSQPTRAPEGSPNIVIILLDDVGFAQLGAYGSDIDTPNIDALADRGVTFTNFHTTALCSPTRACVLTGRNHHRVGMGRITDLATGFPGYDTSISHTHGFLPAMLEPLGWATCAVGKWHLTPRSEHHLGATRKRWPLGRGFQRYYGFFEGETNHFAPTLIHDNHQAEVPDRDGYHFTEDMADTSIEWLTDLRNADPDKPFLLYFATGACHSPHQAPREFIERYRGRFDQGWDRWRQQIYERQIAEGIIAPTTELSPRPDWVPAWDSLSDDERRVYARYMEAFAGMLTHTDEQIGRLIGFLDETGDLDNTIVMVLSDNGASSEGGPGGSLNDLRTWNILDTPLDEALERIDEIGGPTIHNNYPWGWTVAGNTPFRRWKREVHEGGVADPFIVHWPAGLSRSGRRRQFAHAIDIVPTLLEACGVEPPATLDGHEQSSIDGFSLMGPLTDPDHDEVHITQYFEMFGCRAIYHDGYKAVTFHPIHVDPPGLDTVEWELYDVRVDPSECHDLAADLPEKVAELDALFWAEAERNRVLPLDNRPFSEFTMSAPQDPPAHAVTVLRPGGGEIPEQCAPDVKNRTHRVSCHIDVGDSLEGVLVSQGSVYGGWVLCIDEGDLAWHLNVATRRFTTVRAELRLDPGEHTVGFEYRKTEELAGEVSLLVDREVLTRGDVDFYAPSRFSLTGAGLTVGRANHLPVSDMRGAGRPFTGDIDSVVVELFGPPWSDPEADAQAAIAAQ